MAAQNYANHRQRAVPWLVGWFSGVIGTVMLLWAAVSARSTQSVALVLLGVAAVTGVTLARTYALRLQNRIIRLEMQVRLARLGRERDLDRLSAPQLIAVRFASDAELPALIDRAVAEKLTPDQIKRTVTDWQGDHSRV